MIRFSKYFILYACISGLIIIPGMYSLIRFQMKPSIDFTGGTLIEFAGSMESPREKILQLAEPIDISVTDITVNKTGQISVRFKSTDENKIKQFETSLKETVGDNFSILKSESVGPILGRELMRKAIAAAFVAIMAILFYIAYAFKNIKYGVSAVVALFHDVLVMFGSFSLLGHFLGIEVDALFVTAFLTTMSFSVHDTIVIFDRIREYRKRDSRTPLDELSDIALTQTMGRSLVNSFTIVFMLLALVLMGGETVRWFAVALLIGTFTGTYSSPFVATPILVLWDRWEQKKQHHPD